MSRRINHADGSFGGVALATIKIDYFSRFTRGFDIGRARRRRPVQRQRHDADAAPLQRPHAVGASVPPLPLYTRYLTGRTPATAIFRRGSTASLRFNSYCRLDDYPLVVSAALSKDEMLADWRTDAWRTRPRRGLHRRRRRRCWASGWSCQIEQRVQAETELRQARDALETLNARWNSWPCRTA